MGLSEHTVDDLLASSPVSFNPPGGFGAFGTGTEARGRSLRREKFQSAGRIWGFRNVNASPALVSRSKFQSAGRIWGFRNSQHRRATIPPSGVSIRRADLGLSELRAIRPPFSGCSHVSIRRADLGLSERRCVCGQAEPGRFNPPGGFGAFGTSDTGFVTCGYRWMFQSAGRIWGFRNRGGGLCITRDGVVSIRRADLGLSELRPS